MMSTNTGATHIYFNSVCLTIVALVFVILVIFVYIKKEKVKSATTSLYLIAICFNVALILFDFLVPFGIKIVIGEMSGNVFFAKFLCRTFLFLCYFYHY